MSKVYHDQNAREEYNILSESYNNSTFKTLISKWEIKPYEHNSSQFKYEVQFEFRNFLLQSVSSIFLNEV